MPRNKKKKPKKEKVLLLPLDDSEIRNNEKVVAEKTGEKLGDESIHADQSEEE